MTRAAHLEVTRDLSADAFISAVRRFVAHRRQVEHIYSDNGTNLVGVESVLRQVIINSWNLDQIHEHLRQSDVQWSFNSPTASHVVEHGSVPIQRPF